MVSSLSNSLAALLLNPYAQAALVKPRDAIDPIKPGATVTARYSVEDDGSLALRDVDIANKVDAATDATTDQRNARRDPQEQLNGRPTSFADLAKPKATISPSDEIFLFAAAGDKPLQLAAPKLQANGAGITDIESDDDSFLENDKVLDITAQRQQLRVTGLYARNNDITYNIDPAYSEAA